MNNSARNLITKAIVAFVIVLPFMILELINRRSLPEGFPLMLFGAMWLLSFLSVLILMPILRSLRAGATNSTNRLILLPKVVLLTVIAGALVILIVDQMPCFLGVPNCD